MFVEVITVVAHVRYWARRAFQSAGSIVKKSKISSCGSEQKMCRFSLHLAKSYWVKLIHLAEYND